jgi:hypothetical protein
MICPLCKRAINIERNVIGRYVPCCTSPGCPLLFRTKRSFPHAEDAAEEMKFIIEQIRRSSK